MKTTSKGHAKLSHGFADFWVTPLGDTACGGASANREKHFQENGDIYRVSSIATQQTYI